MKIKRFNNLWTMGLILSASILGLVYLLKIFFPEFVIEVAHIESIVTVGRYIDTHKWAWYLASCLFSFATYYLLCSACAGTKKLPLKSIIIIASCIIIMYLCKEFMDKYYTTLNYISMIMLPYLTKGKMKNTAICFTALNVLQLITLEIRSLSMMIIDFNYATFMVLTIDYYILQILLYFMFNNEKEN